MLTNRVLRNCIPWPWWAVIFRTRFSVRLNQLCIGADIRARLTVTIILLSAAEDDTFICIHWSVLSNAWWRRLISCYQWHLLQQCCLLSLIFEPSTYLQKYGNLNQLRSCAILFVSMLKVCYSCVIFRNGMWKCRLMDYEYNEILSNARVKVKRRSTINVSSMYIHVGNRNKLWTA